MFIRAMVSECDFTGEKFDTPVEGFHFFARGATGRVCHVMDGGPNAPKFSSGPSTIEEVEAWAKSVPGGYLDY